MSNSERLHVEVMTTYSADKILIHFSAYPINTAAMMGIYNSTLSFALLPFPEVDATA